MIKPQLRPCFRCDSVDVAPISVSEDFGHEYLNYSFWCNVCDKPYSYRLQLDSIQDSEGRI